MPDPETSESSRPRLWSWELSPFAAKAKIALAVRQVDVQLIEIDPMNRPARLAELNPARTVPVLEVDGAGIWQSTAICEWAEETGSGPSLWPADCAQRGRARGLLRWVDDELTTNFFLASRKRAFGLDERFDHPDMVQNLRGTLVKRYRPLERMLNATPGPWLCGGEEALMPDLAALPLAVRLPEWGPKLVPDADTFPAVTRWLEALREHPLAAEVTRRGEAPPDGQ